MKNVPHKNIINMGGNNSNPYAGNGYLINAKINIGRKNSPENSNQMGMYNNESFSLNISYQNFDTEPVGK